MQETRPELTQSDPIFPFSILVGQCLNRNFRLEADLSLPDSKRSTWS